MIRSHDIGTQNIELIKTVDFFGCCWCLSLNIFLCGTLSMCQPLFSWDPGLLTCLSDQPLRSDEQCDYRNKRSWPLYFHKVGAKRPKSIRLYTLLQLQRVHNVSFRCPHQWSMMEGFEIGHITLWLCINLPDNTDVIMYELLKWKICFSVRVMLVRFLNHCDTCTPVPSHVDWLRARLQQGCGALHYTTKGEKSGNNSVFSNCFQSVYFTQGMCKKL